MTATVFPANRSNVLIDGEALEEGLTSLAYRVVTEREDVRAIGSDERTTVSFGLRTVQGEIAVKSASFKLDEIMNKQAAFQIVVDVKKDESFGLPQRRVSFDDCFVENKDFSVGSGGAVASSYMFTATRVREE